jgi:hypothetical protein
VREERVVRDLLEITGFAKGHADIPNTLGTSSESSESNHSFSGSRFDCNLLVRAETRF